MERRLRDSRHRPLALTTRAAACVLAGAAAAWPPSAGARLGEPLTLRPGPGPAVHETTFVLPRGSAQGKTGWYELRLRARAVFGRTRGRGNAYLSADTNGRTAAQIRFQSVGAQRRVVWDAVGIVDGSQGGSFSRSALITFRNLVQDRGIHGGTNRLSFRVETIGRPGLERVTVLPGAGVYRTAAGPARVVIDVAGAGALRAGEDGALTVRVRNTGMRAARQITVESEGPPGLQVQLEVHAPFALAAGESRLLRASVRAEHPGSYRLAFVGNASSNLPATAVELRFDARERRELRRAVAASAAVALGLLALVLIGTGRRRS